jgi:hypothetical protein
MSFSAKQKTHFTQSLLIKQANFSGLRSLLCLYCQYFVAKYDYLDKWVKRCLFLKTKSTNHFQMITILLL